MNTVNKGIYPAMLTLYDRAGNVDVGAVRALTQWYAEKGCQGVFAACLSSEIFSLSLEERVLIARTTVDAAPDSMDVVVSGHTHLPTPHGIDELKAMADTGAKALVLIASRLAEEDESEDVVRRNIYAIMEALPDIDLGLYECPVPYHRLFSASLLGELAKTDRFVFVKDTCCSVVEMAEKMKVIQGTRLQLLNANSATLLQSLQIGVAGLCGVMGNYHPDLYVRLMELAETDPEKAQELQDELGVLSSIQYPTYQTNARFYLELEGVPVASYASRACPDGSPSEADREEMRQRYALTQRLREKWL